MLAIVLAKIKITFYFGNLIYKRKLFEEIELSFLIQGYNKFGCDKYFVLAKKEMIKNEKMVGVEDVTNIINCSNSSDQA